MEKSSLKHSVFDYSYSEFFTNGQNKSFFCLKDRQTNKQGLADAKGNLVIPFKYDYVDWFNEGLAEVEQEGKYGFIDKNGKAIVPLVYEAAYYFGKGIVRVKKGGKWLLFDTSTGKFIE